MNKLVEEEKQQIRLQIKKQIKHIKKEVNYTRNFFDDSDKLKNYLYYLHGLFSKLESKLVKLEKI